MATMADEELEKIFADFDDNGDCSLSEEEVEKALNFDPLDIKRAFMHVDADENGTLDVEEFKNFYRAFVLKDEVVLKSLKDTYYRRVFNKFDDDSNGKLDIEENVQAVMFMSRGDGSKESIRAMIVAADTDGDGLLDIEEFVAYNLSKD